MNNQYINIYTRSRIIKYQVLLEILFMSDLIDYDILLLILYYTEKETKRNKTPLLFLINFFIADI